MYLPPIWKWNHHLILTENDIEKRKWILRAHQKDLMHSANSNAHSRATVGALNPVANINNNKHSNRMSCSVLDHHHTSVAGTCLDLDHHILVSAPDCNVGYNTDCNA